MSDHVECISWIAAVTAGSVADHLTQIPKSTATRRRSNGIGWGFACS
jgi:hypothetical protein